MGHQSSTALDSYFSRFIGGIISVGLGTLSTMTMGLLGVMVITRHLPAETFGSYVLTQVAAAFLTRVSSLGLDVSVAKFIADTEDDNERQRIIGTVLCFQLCKIMCVCIITLSAKQLFSMLLDVSPLDNIFGFVLLFYFLESSGQLLKSILQGLFFFGSIAKSNFIASFLGFFAIVFFIIFMNIGLLGLLLAKGVSIAIAYAFLLHEIPLQKKISFDFRRLKKILQFGFPLYLNSILGFVFIRIDTLMIGAVLGPAQTAYYEIARKIPESLMGLYDAFNTVYYPSISKFFASNRQHEATQLLNHSTRVLTFLGVLGTLIALLFGDVIISSLFSRQYVPSVPVFFIMMVGLVLMFLDETLGYSLVASGDSDKPLYINAVHAVASLLSNIALIPLFGIVGAALAGVAGYAVANPMSIFFLRRRLINVKIMAYVKPIFIFILYWLFIRQLEPTSRLLQGAIILFFLATCWLFSVVTIRDLDMLLQEARAVVTHVLLRIRSWSART